MIETANINDAANAFSDAASELLHLLDQLGRKADHRDFDPNVASGLLDAIGHARAIDAAINFDDIFHENRERP